MSFKITQIDTILSSLKTNREETPISNARSLDINIDGSFIVSYPLISSLYHYPQNPNNTNYITNIIKTIQGTTQLDFPLDAKFNNGKIWIADNTRILCLNSYTYEHIVSKTLSGIIYAVTPFANGCFVSLFTSITSAQILHLDNNCNIISTFSFDATYPLSTLKIERTYAFIESLPSPYSICYDDIRNRLWWVNNSISYMVDILTKTVSTYDLSVHNVSVRKKITIDLESGHAFIVTQDYLSDNYIEQMNKDNTEYIGKSYLKTDEFEYYFVAMGDGTNECIYSKDGKTWYESINGNSTFGIATFCVCYNGTMFVGGGCGPILSGTNSLGYSYDGINWLPSANGNSFLNSACLSVCWGNNKFIAVGQGGNPITYSYDGINWIGSIVPITFANGYSVCSGNSMFVIGGSSNSVLYSYDGINWNISTTGSALMGVGYGIAWNENIFVMVGNSSNSVIYSYDGIVWQASASGHSFNDNLKGICWGEDKFVAVGYSGYTSIIYSYDGITWFASANGNTLFNIVDNCYALSVCWNGSKFVATGSGTNPIAYSTDGITWTKSLNGNSLFSAGNGITSTKLLTG